MIYIILYRNTARAEIFAYAVIYFDMKAATDMAQEMGWREFWVKGVDLT